MGIRLVVVDDNPHVSWEGRTYPVNATFQRFVAGLLDLPGSPVASITSCVPLRPASSPPVTLPLDPRIRVVGTAPFDGIEGYLRHMPAMLRANRPLLRAALAEADLVWLKVPASNALLAAVVARAAGVPRFVWVAGNARDVARARYGSARHGRALGGVAAAAGMVYDGIGRAAAVGGDRVVVGRDIDRGGIVASLVETFEMREPSAPAEWVPGTPLSLVWAGRVAHGKGLESLLASLAVMGDRANLTLIGDGPARTELEATAAALGIGGRVRWAGYIADREPYLAALHGHDLFVFPSEAEGFPKVVLDALAVGLPVLARPSGALHDLDVVMPMTDLARDVAALDASGPAAWSMLARRRHAFARDHVRVAELDRLVRRWRSRWPNLSWG